MRYVITALTAAAFLALAGCDRPSTTSSTTVVKEPVVQKEKETVITQEPSQPSSSTTVVQAPEQPQPTTTERSRSTTTSRVDTPVGSVTRTETETSKTTK